ncbi:MAG: TetR/AcrR family transcriptional regulator [Pseudomonadota bacterium]
MRNTLPADATEKRALSSKLILDEALELVKSEGIDFSMRDLASRLGVWPMAIYRYYSNRDALISAIIDTVLASALNQELLDELLDDSLDWQVRVETYCLNLYDILILYPGVARNILHGALDTPNGLRLIESTAAIFMKFGFSQEKAAIAFQSLGFFVTEMAMLHFARQAGQSDAEGLLAKAQASRDKTPAAYEYLKIMTAIDLKDRLKASLGLLIRGIEVDFVDT